MLSTRVIPCLLLQDGGLVKTVKFKNPKYVGDPINAVKIFNEKEVDELIFLDIDASRQGREPQYDVIENLATECFMPFAYGGGVTTIDQIKRILRIGVEKIVVNHAAMKNMEFVREACRKFGSSTIIGAVDVNTNLLGKRRVYDHVAKSNLDIDLLDYIKTLEHAGVGEMFINFVYKDGTYSGYDLETIKQISTHVNVPLIVCGGAARLTDFSEATKTGGASAVAAGSLFVYHGPHKAVLISYPTQNELKKIF